MLNWKFIYLPQFFFKELNLDPEALRDSIFSKLGNYQEKEVGNVTNETDLTFYFGIDPTLVKNVSEAAITFPFQVKNLLHTC